MVDYVCIFMALSFIFYVVSCLLETEEEEEVYKTYEDLEREIKEHVRKALDIK